MYVSPWNLMWTSSLSCILDGKLSDHWPESYLSTRPDEWRLANGDITVEERRGDTHSSWHRLIKYSGSWRLARCNHSLVQPQSGCNHFGATAPSPLLHTLLKHLLTYLLLITSFFAYMRSCAWPEVVVVLFGLVGYGDWWLVINVILMSSRQLILVLSGNVRYFK